MRQLVIIIWIILISCQLFAKASPEPDTVSSDTISELPVFNTASAWLYLDEAIGDSQLWRSEEDTIREALQRLLDQTREPYDTARQRLFMQDFRFIPVHAGDPVVVRTVDTRWINDSTFVTDPQGWNSELYLKQEVKLVYPVDFSTLTLSDSLLDANGMLDSALFTPDTLMVDVIDTAALAALEISLYNYSGNVVTPPLSDPVTGLVTRLSEDRARVEYFSPSTTWLADDTSPFHILKGKQQLDSLQMAVNTLLDYTGKRDSTMVLINDTYGKKTPFWITSGSDDASRFWVKNYNNDSITLWIGNPGTGEISLLLEDDVNVSRLVKEEIRHLPSFLEPPDRSLRAMTMLEPAPIYWDYELSNVVTLNQSYLSNWTKGGESSLTIMADLFGRATYNNKEAKTQWINSVRLKYGTIMSEEKGFRKNHDLFEITSKFNRNAWGKIGMSASFYMKNQMAKGYDYPNDSVAVSKFLNPGTLTVGLGVEYKPFENTTINIAPLSYKTTFVLDTARIDQTRHGIDADHQAKKELGTQIVVDNKISPLKGLEVTNRLRLFSNYLNHPENIDIDWEIILEKKINWFFTIRLDLHLIYDDDILFTVYDDADQPVILPDGSEKEVAKAQFKEFLGLSLQFKF